jgi:hypothetical protein
MPNTIPNETVEAQVIQFNNHYYLRDGQYAPQTQNILCGINALVDPYQWWMVPVKNFGIVSILQAVPAINGNETQPTPDSISVIRIRDKYNPGYTWFVICSLEDYYAACAACCGDTPVPIPLPTLPVIVPCQKVCEAQNTNGDYFVTFAAPVLGAGEQYFVYGQFDEEELADFQSTSLDDLVNDLNTNYGTVGSPAVDITWTRNGTTIIGTFDNGLGVDSTMCLLIIAEIPSP